MNESSNKIKRSTRKKILLKKCHVCSFVNETTHELQKCSHCKKSFLPSHYFAKIHNHDKRDFEQLFNDAEELEENTLVKGLHVIW